MTLSGTPVTVNLVSQMIENTHQLPVIPIYDLGGHMRSCSVPPANMTAVVKVWCYNSISPRWSALGEIETMASTS